MLSVCAHVTSVCYKWLLFNKCLMDIPQDSLIKGQNYLKSSFFSTPNPVQSFPGKYVCNLSLFSIYIYIVCNIYLHVILTSVQCVLVVVVEGGEGRDTERTWESKIAGHVQWSGLESQSDTVPWRDIHKSRPHHLSPARSRQPARVRKSECVIVHVVLLKQVSQLPLRVVSLPVELMRQGGREAPPVIP